MQGKTTYKPLRSCGCHMCRAGRATVWGKTTLRQAEKFLRQHAKLGLRLDPLNYESVLAPTDYTD